MESKNSKKLWVDVLLIISFMLFFNVRAVKLDIHEVLGMAIIIPFVIHFATNWTWVISMGKNLFSKETPKIVKVQYTIDILLLISMILIILSGIFISKTILTNIVGRNHILWKIIHVGCSYLALVLSSIHIGLNWGWVVSMLKQLTGRNIGFKNQKVLITGFIAALFFIGGYNVYAKGVIPQTLLLSQVPQILAHGENMKPGEIPAGENQLTPPNFHGKNGATFRKPFNGHQGPPNHGGFPGKGNFGYPHESGLFSTIELLLSYLSIFGFFIILTYFINRHFTEPVNTEHS